MMRARVQLAILCTILLFLQEEKKNFDKQTTKFCASQERHLNMKTKISDSQLKEVNIRGCTLW